MDKKIDKKFSCVIVPSLKTILKTKILFFQIPKRQRTTNIIPIIHLEVEFHFINKDNLRPLKIKQSDGLYLQHRPFMKLLKNAEIIYLPEKFREKILDISNMLKLYQINYEIEQFCRLCLLKNKVSMLDNKNAVFSYNEFLCPNCALDELINELKFLGFKPSKPFLDRMRNILLELKDVKKVLPILKPNFDAFKNPKLTFFDKIKVSTKKTGYLKVEDLNIPNEFIQVLRKSGYEELLPVQDLAIQNGLLEKKNLLIVSSTSSGKTLIGELAGVARIIRERKYKESNGCLIFLNPLKAMSNQQKLRFTERYSKLGINTAIKVGMSQINVKNEDLVIVDDDIKTADIITATYEAFDYLLRKGNIKNEIKQISTLVFDEFQMIGDEERGPILNGLISRIKILFPNVQLIGLSATIKNVNDVAKKFELLPIIYNERPVALERHLVLCKIENDKLFNLAKLIRGEYQNKSSFKFQGSSIIFTNSRIRSHLISNELSNKHGLHVVAYHAGLSYFQRKAIEFAYENGNYQAIITTYALGAGFDSPASQVIFESLFMGINAISPNEFHQMSGRAGRYKMHDMGKVILLAEIGKTLHVEKMSEDQIALYLLESQPEELDPIFEPDKIVGEVLASISSGLKKFHEIENFYDNIFNAEENLTIILEKLKSKKLIYKENEEFYASNLGKAIALSFFTPEEALLIIKELKSHLDPLKIAITSDYFENIYISEKIRNEMTKIYKTQIPTRFFSSTLIDFAELLKKHKKKAPSWLLDLVMNWYFHFFNCECEDRPYCECQFLKSNQKIVEFRFEGLSPMEISNKMEKEFGLTVYTGDIFRFLDNLIYKLNGIGMIADNIGLLEINEKISKLKRRIENPLEFK
ncbi:MAG: DEAD/DEAH box helicase [Candidatus Helarchaeota archaeon]|nr:DEAD/DEAH box helicase [Candidatus Helarchaeota archaeon]